MIFGNLTSTACTFAHLTCTLKPLYLGKSNKCSAVAEMGDHLAIIDMGQKLGTVPLSGGGAGSPSNTMWPALMPASLPRGILIHPAVWPQQTRAENRGEEAVPLWGRGGGSPSDTMWPALMPAALPRGILIHQAV